MKIITHNDIIKHDFSPLECYDWAATVIEKKREAELPPKISLKPRPDIFFNTMPVILSDINRFGVKVVSRFPDRVPGLDSQILLYDLRSGECLALLDGNWITAMRTGAVAAHSIKLFAKKSFSVLGFIGLGNVATASLEVLLALYPKNSFTVKLKKYKAQHDRFKERFKKFSNVIFEYCDEYTDVIKGSDVVVSAATYLDNDICSFSDFDDGVLVVPIHTRGFTQCDYMFDKIFVDDIGHVKHFQHFGEYRLVAEVSDVVNKTAEGRQNDIQKIMAYNIGISAHDIYFASKVYDALADQIRTTVDLEPPTNKLWF